MIRETGAPFSIYPYGYEDDLAKKRAAADLRAAQEDAYRTEIAEKIFQPKEDVITGLGITAVAAMTGMANGRLEQTPPVKAEFAPIVDEKSLTLGRGVVRSIFEIQQTRNAVNEQAFLGYAERQAA